MDLFAAPAPTRLRHRFDALANSEPAPDRSTLPDLSDLSRERDAMYARSDPAGPSSRLPAPSQSACQCDSSFGVARLFGDISPVKRIRVVEPVVPRKERRESKKSD